MSIELDTDASNGEFLSQLFDTISSSWRGRQMTVEDARLVYDSIQDRVMRLIFSQEVDSEQTFSRLSNLLRNLSALSMNHREVDLLFATDKGLYCRFRDGRIEPAGLHKFWHKHKKAIIITAIAVAVIVTVALVVITTGGASAPAVTAVGGAAISGAQASAQEDKPVQATTAPPAPEPMPIAPPPLPLAAPPPRDLPVFLDNGVMLDGQHYAYWQFLQKAKQEEFFTHFLNGTRPDAAKAPTPSLNPHNEYQPIPPQPGSGLLRNLFETLGRQILAPEVIAEIPAPELQKTHLFTTAGKRSSSCCIGGINGINTSLNNAVDHANYVGQFAQGQSIDWVYNNSHGAVAGLAEVFVNYLGISPNTAQELRDNWVAFHESNRNNPKARYFQICHSQGAIHVKNALSGLPQEIRDRIIVLAIAPAAVVPDELCFASFNYASKRDIVPMGELVFAGFFDTDDVVQSQGMKIAQERHQELILLDPHPDATGIDHDFQSPTFLQIIDKHVQDYIAHQGEYDFPA